MIVLTSDAGTTAMGNARTTRASSTAHMRRLPGV